MGSTNSIQKLAEIGSKPLMSTLDEALGSEILTATGAGLDLLKLLMLKNGFYAFESALHVFPVVKENWFNEQDLQRWNRPELWKDAYRRETVLHDATFFAEDVIGSQFGFMAGRIIRFDPETGETEDMCSSLEEWAETVLADYDEQVGYQLAHEWQKQKGVLLQGNRLMPIVPLIAKEGRFKPDNFYQLEAAKCMLVRADLAVQLRSIPDGGSVMIKPINMPR